MERGVIKSLPLEDFLTLYKEFEKPPYQEKFTREEVEKIYKNNVENGELIGYYIGDKCVSCGGYYKCKEGEHPVKFKNPEKVAYASELITLEEYRKKGIGSNLSLEMFKRIRDKGYEIIYMRTLNPEQSLSYKLAILAGFQLLKEVQNVQVERTHDSREKVDKRVFLSIEVSKINIPHLLEILNKMKKH